VRILRDEPTPLIALRPSLPVALERVVGRAMAKNREDRFQSAVEMQAVLLASLPSEDEAPPDTVTEPHSLPRLAPSSSPSPSPY
jgi:serine/threonine-protein kinase